MSFTWKLKEICSKNEIKNAQQLKIALNEELGIDISLQALHNLLNKTPKSLKIETIEILCSLFKITSSELFIATPRERAPLPKKLIKPYMKRKEDLPFLNHPDILFNQDE